VFGFKFFLSDLMNKWHNFNIKNSINFIMCCHFTLENLILRDYPRHKIKHTQINSEVVRMSTCIQSGFRSMIHIACYVVSVIFHTVKVKL